MFILNGLMFHKMGTMHRGTDTFNRMHQWWANVSHHGRFQCYQNLIGH
jgi:hypothetical protein